MIPKRVTQKQVDEILAVLGLDANDLITHLVVNPRKVTIAWDTFDGEKYYSVTTHTVSLEVIDD